MKELKNSESVTITLNGKPLDVPAEGALGLLALGHVGLSAWRKKRIETGLEEELKVKKTDPVNINEIKTDLGDE
jgi:hypothetical protein